MATKINLQKVVSRYVRIEWLWNKPTQINTRDLSSAFDVLELRQETTKKKKLLTDWLAENAKCSIWMNNASAVIIQPMHRLSLSL